MKNFYLKCILSCLFGLIGLMNSTAQENVLDFSINDEHHTAEVFGRDRDFSGGIIIPSTIEEEGVIYTVTSIGERAFAGCSGLISITIPNSVTSIGEAAFGGCSGLISITIPNSVTTISERAFKNCRSLTSVAIPNSVISIGREAFEGCSGLTAVHIKDLANWCKISFDTSSSNPLRYAHHLYLNGEEVKSLAFPSSITSIGDCVFYGCSGLTAVSIPNSITNISIAAFAECTNVATVIIDNDLFVGLLGDQATSYTLGNHVTSIPNRAFEECSNLTSIEIPNSVISIGDYAFSGCSNLASIVVGEGVQYIGRDAFSQTPWYDNMDDGVIYFNNVLYKYKGIMPKNTSIIIKEGTMSISPFAFDAFDRDENWYTQERMVSMTIPESVTSIGDGAFYECSGLKSIIIPPNVTAIAPCTFSGCTRLTSITIPDGVTSIGWDAFIGCEGLTSVAIPNSVTAIEDGAFRGCYNLTSLTIPEGVKTIGSSAFHDCYRLKTITLPSSVTFIGSSTFEDCGNLRDIYCWASTVPETQDTKFFPDGPNPEKLITLHVPEGAIGAYQSTKPWSRLGRIVAIGKEVEIVPMKENTNVTFDGNITEGTDLTDTVIDNVYVTLNTDENDGYDTEKKCLVLASTVTDEQLANIADKEVQNIEVKNNFNGLILEVPEGQGVIGITAQTKGNSTLNVKVGDSEVQSFVRPERCEVEVTYTVEKDTYVYIYGAEAAASTKHRGVASDNVENGVLIYSIKCTQGDATDIDTITTGKSNGTYSIYTLDGKPAKTLQQGVNIIRYSDGKTQKVFVK